MCKKKEEKHTLNTRYARKEKGIQITKLNVRT